MTTFSFTINAAELSTALSLLLVTLEPKTTIPILSFVRVESGEGEIKLSATDMDCAVTVGVPTTITQPIALCMPLRDVSELVRLIKGDIAFEVKGEWIWATSDKIRHRFATMPADQLPIITGATDEVATLDGTLLAAMIDAAMIAAETNPNGEERWRNVEVAAKGGELSITGTNGSRLANATTACEAEFYALLPRRSADVLNSFASDSETVTLSLNDNLITARSAKGEASLKLSALVWPDWHALIQSSYTDEIEIDPVTLLPALRRSILTCNDTKGVANIAFELSGDTMSLTAQGRDRESQEDVAITCPSLNGNTRRIGMAGDQMLDFFRVCKGAAIWHVPEGTAQRFTPKEPLAFGFQYVQATMRK